MTTTVKFLDLPAQYRQIKPEIDAAIAEVIGAAAFIGGPHPKAFEENFARYLGAAHCIGVGNGTDAIEIALEALALPPGSEVMVPANSFIATSESVTRSGLKVVFCAADPETYLLDLAEARRLITPKTSALIVVHLYGHPCDMTAVNALAREFGLRVIEDSAQAHGAEVRGRRVGTLGDIGCFSFYPGKNLGAYGDGGAIVTQDAALAERARMIANHGRKAKYDHEFEGRNSRLDGLQAAILNVKLRHLDAWTTRRIATAAAYQKVLAGVGGLVLPQTRDWGRHVFPLYVVRTKQRDALAAHLSANGIQTGIRYPIALPALAAYRGLGQHTASDALHDQLLSIPMGEHLSAADVETVANAIKSFWSR